MQRLHSSLLFTIVSLSASACALDSLVLTEFTRQDNPLLPPYENTTLRGLVAGLPGGTVAFLADNGQPSPALAGTVDSAGAWSIVIPGTTSLTNGIVAANKGRRAIWGLAPFIPTLPDALAPARAFEFSQLTPAMKVLDGRTTTIVLLLLAEAASQGQPIGSISPDATVQAIADLDAAIKNDAEPFVTLRKMVDRLLAAASDTATGAGSLRAILPAPGASFLDIAFLEGGIDYTGDGSPDLDTSAFDQAVAACTGAFDFKACYAPDRIRVVIQADFRDATKDGNCDPIDKYTWSSNVPGKQVFITGGLHKDTPVCKEDRTTQCLQAAQVDEVNQALGNWVPNITPMWDDGTHGDGTGGDGIWTFALELPYWSPQSAPDKAGVRIAYKFTYGKPSQGWTDSEEFPGNQRILEISDLNGDHVVVRRDAFADEASNKDKSNLLSPSKGGCGTVQWPTTAKADCSSDSVERMVDTDGDCKPDTWPIPGRLGPLTVPVKEDGTCP